MMSYDSKFVLCALHKGSPVREIGNTIHLPYHSNYKIRLKNKHSYVRAKARVWIDGRPVSNLGDFILQPNDTLDLERFLDHSLTSGNKFKFVPLSDGRVNDPTDPENGIIKVEFYRETQPLSKSPVRPLSKGFNPDITDNWATNYVNNNFTYTGSGGDETTCSVNYVNTLMPICDSSIESGAGATVEGGYSGQSFSYGSDFPTEFLPVTLTLRLRGIDRREVDWEDHPNTPRGPKKRIKFCPSCGGRRHGMAKFCHQCGTAYHPRYENERGRIVR